jgi:hypothetical protein
LEKYVAEIDRTSLLDCLATWGHYMDDFHRLSANRQASFLLRQGYQRFGDLLAHVAGWWEEGLRVVDEVRANANFIYVEPDTDAFNADIVLKFAATDEAEIAAYFESIRRKMVVMIEASADEILSHPLVREWLFADVIEHFEEHRLES